MQTQFFTRLFIYLRRQGTVGLLFAAILLILAGFGLNALNNIRLVNNTEQVTHTYQVLNAIEKFLSSVKDTETGQRGFCHHR